jgi:hypothetical protein
MTRPRPINSSCVSAFLILITFPVHGQSGGERTLAAFLAGKTATYSSLHEPKSLGLEFSLQYPTSWVIKPGNRPHILAKIIAPQDEVITIIQVRAADVPFTEKDLDETFTVEGLKNMMEEGASYVTCDPSMRIEGLRAGYLEYTKTGKRVDLNLYMHTGTFVTCYKKYMIMVMFVIGNTDRSENATIDRRYAEYKGLFKAIFNSLVIQSIYR